MKKETVEIACRCRDCIYFEEIEDEGYCGLLSYDIEEDISVSTSFFCAHAVDRENP